MDSSYPNVSPLWDLTQPPNYAQVSDDDFMALLHKQFPLVPTSQGTTRNFHPIPVDGHPDGVNPQTISQYPLPSLSPSSEDSSSPSPSQANANTNGSDANADDSGNGNRGNSSPATDSALKRKASSVDIQEQAPSQKSQHTLLNDKKGAASVGGSRRKSTGGIVKDESRLLKRKEQNRAAQRAFRERKEKHVKDLEDKVAELEAKNDAAQQENDNLRDLLSRLQSENLQLKQGNFTFSVPHKSPSDSNVPAPRQFPPENSIFGSTSPSSPPSAMSPTNSQSSSKPTNLLDWSSLTSFDPNVLNLLDENSQPTATTSAMNLDFFNENDNTGLVSTAPLTMIASNPMFMSFASSFDNMYMPTTENSSGGNNSNNNGNRNGQPFSFDINAMSWQAPTPQNQDTSSLDDLLAGYLGANNNDFSSMGIHASTPSLSPVAHQASVSNPSYANFSNSNNDNNVGSFVRQSPLAANPSLSSSSSPSSQSTSSSDPSLNTPKESHSVPISATPESDHHLVIAQSATGSDSPTGGKKVDETCPKTKQEFAKRIVDAGASPFAPVLQKSSDQVLGTVITCSGSKFPMTQKNDKNVEVLSAWRTITSNPVFKDANIDINDLCHEFTSKAKCDAAKKQ